MIALTVKCLFSLVHCGEDTAVCVTKHESSETEALVECEERELINNIHIDRHKYPPSAASAPASLNLSLSHTHTDTHTRTHAHTHKFSGDATDSRQLQGSRLLKLTFHNFKTVNTLTFLN